EVVEALELALTYPSEEVQAEAAAALGRLGARDSRDRLVEVMRQSPSFKVRIAAAEAAGRLGASGKDFFDLMHATENWKLRRQLAIAIGDSFGNPGEVYHFMTGDQNQNIQSLYRLSDL